MTPQELLLEFNRHHRDLTSRVNDYLTLRAIKMLPEWPKWCLLPMELWVDILNDECAGQDEQHQAYWLFWQGAQMAPLGTWRFSQGIYRFDSSVYDAVAKTPLTGDIPADVLKRLPEWVVYIETPGLTYLGHELNGFFAGVEENSAGSRLNFLFNRTDGKVCSTGIPLTQQPLLECARQTMESQQAFKKKLIVNTDANLPTLDAEEIAKDLQVPLSLVHDLCSDEPEVDDERRPGTSPCCPEPRKCRHGWKLMPADGAKVWSVGKTLGETLRKTEATEEEGAPAGAHKSPRAHLRRGHWHGYWTGPRAGERRFSYKWLMPIIVNAGR